MKRVIYTIVLIFFVIILNWIIFEAMPGVNGALYAVLGQSGRLPPGEYQRQLELYGLNKPYWVQFYDYVRNMLTFQFGFSSRSNLDVTSEMIQSGRLVNTLLLLGTSTMMALIIGTVAGVFISRRRGSTVDTFATTTSLATLGLPVFFTGTLLIYVFAEAVNWFPSGSNYPSVWDVSGYPTWWAQIPVRLERTRALAVQLYRLQGLSRNGGHVLHHRSLCNRREPRFRHTLWRRRSQNTIRIDQKAQDSLWLPKKESGLT